VRTERALRSNLTNCLDGEIIEIMRTIYYQEFLAGVSIELSGKGKN
jgi:hypothetical protein